MDRPMAMIQKTTWITWNTTLSDFFICDVFLNDKANISNYLLKNNKFLVNYCRCEAISKFRSVYFRLNRWLRWILVSEPLKR